jgi:hypothetical protein
LTSSCFVDSRHHHGDRANLINNLPMGLIAATTTQAAQSSHHITGAVLIGVDLEPNLSVTGSLATILWLIAFMREGEHVGASEPPQEVKLAATAPSCLISRSLIGT